MDPVLILNKHTIIDGINNTMPTKLNDDKYNLSSECSEYLANTGFEIKINYNNPKNVDPSEATGAEIIDKLISLMPKTYKTIAYLLHTYGDMAYVKLKTTQMPAYKCETPRMLDFTCTRVLLGCPVCNVRSELSEADIMDTKYTFNTKIGDCGRPLLYYDLQSKSHWFLGIHCGGSAKFNTMTPVECNLKTMDVFADYKGEEPEACLESVAKIMHLPGNPASLDDEFIDEPLAGLIPDSYIDKSKYEVKGADINAVLKGVSKYEKHKNTKLEEFPNLKEVLSIFMPWWAPYFEGFQANDNFDDWMYAMQHGGQQHLKHSSPGYPFNQEYYDKITWLRKHGRELFYSIENELVLTYATYFVFSPKFEVRDRLKDQRMYCGAPITHTGTGVYLFKYIFDRARVLRSDTTRPFRYGLSLQEMSQYFSEMYGVSNYGMSYDVDGCDTSIPKDFLIYVFTWIKNFIPEKYHVLFDYYVNEVIFTDMKLPNNDVYRKDMGNPSGHFLTTLVNSLWSSFVWLCAYCACLKKYRTEWMKFLADPFNYYISHVIAGFTGDDTVVSFLRAPYFSKEEVKANLPPNVNITFDYPNEPCDRHNVTFLSLRNPRKEEVPRKYWYVNFPIVHSKPDRMLVKMLYRKKSQDHTVFYNKVCNALCYCLFDDVWNKRFTYIKQKTEQFMIDHDLKFRMTSIVELENIRGVIQFEIGRSLNNFSQFKTSMSQAMPQARNFNRGNKNPSTNNNNQKKNKNKKKKMKNNNNKKNFNTNKDMAIVKQQNPNGRPYFSQRNNNNSNVGYQQNLDNMRVKLYREPRVRAMFSKYEEVVRAANNMFRILKGGACDAGAVAPINTNSLKIASTSFAGDILELPNFANSQNIYKSMVIMHNNPIMPVLYTSSSLAGVPFTSNVVNGTVEDVGDASFLEIYSRDAWGLWMDGARQGGVISVPNETSIPGYEGIIYPHKWIFEIGPDDSGTQKFLYFIMPNNISMNCFWRVNYTGAWNMTSINGAFPGVLITGLSIVSGNSIEIALQVSSANFEPFTIKMVSSNSSGNDQLLRFVNPGFVPALTGKKFEKFYYNLKGFTEVQYDALKPSVDAIRVNASNLVLTNSNALMFNANQCTMGMIANNAPPQNDYLTYLYRQPTKLQLNFIDGSGASWFAGGNDLAFRTDGEFTWNNLARPNTSVHMQIITGTAAGGGSNDILLCALKYDAWLDYTSSDPTRSPVSVIAHNDEWATIMSICSKIQVYSCNPKHYQVLDVMKKAVKFMMSGDSRAVAIRKAVGNLATEGAARLLSSVV